MKLDRKFYLRPTLDVAKDLIGKFLVRKVEGDFSTSSKSKYCLSKARTIEAMITETEAYIGSDDKACHASRGKTKRNEVMFSEGGHAYVYFIYGMYYCLNIVTEKEGFPAAVLIRGLDYPNADLSRLGGRAKADGPGKLCRAFNITKENSNGLDLTGNKMWIEDRGIKPEYEAFKRVGIDYAGECKDYLWRFKIKDVSRKKS